MSTAARTLAYFWGEDAFGIDNAVAAFAVQVGGDDGPLDIWRSPSDDEAATDAADGGGTTVGKRRTRALDDAVARLSTGTLFGAGTLVVIRQPGALLRENAARDRVLGMLSAIPHGNALAFADLLAPGSRGPASQGQLREAVAAAGGVVGEFPALTRDRMEGWLASRAKALEITLGPGAARLLAERVGAYVRESDIDRRRQAELADSELRKLALYRPAGTVSREDVGELVPEAIPGSTWAFLDAVAGRQPAEAATIGERLMAGGTLMPVLVAQLHRRLRDLIAVREHLDEGSRPADLVRVMRLQPYRAQKLAEQAARWSATSLDGALEGLLELDLRSKGITLDGSTAQMSETRDALGLQMWIAEHTARR